MDVQSKNKTHKQYATLRVNIAFIERNSSAYKFR